MTVALPELASWVVSPGYDTDTVREPVAVGTILAEHLANAPEPLSTHELLGVNLTVPVGVVGVVEVSVTVAVHDVASSVSMVIGVQATPATVEFTGTAVTCLRASLGEL